VILGKNEEIKGKIRKVMESEDCNQTTRSLIRRVIIRNITKDENFRLKLKDERAMTVRKEMGRIC
jgi:hypothetical protein